MKSLKSAMVSKNVFLGSISKEMTTPVDTIIHSAYMMTKDTEITEEHQKNLELISNSGVTLFNAINNILDISKLETGKMEIRFVEYELPALISQITTLHTTEHTGVRFVLNIDEKLPVRLYGDRFNIQKICLKMLDSAFKYTSKGTITFSVSGKPDGGKLWLSFKVSDTGTGISKSELDNLLFNYDGIDVAGKLKTGGTTGLGLFINRRLAEMMKGTFIGTSEVGKGSAFSLRVPQKLLLNKTMGPEIVQKLKTFQYS
jgi:signal transduction histidine kinase